jgi:4-hydroxy-tetrahydrodipicolinate synthase
MLQAGVYPASVTPLDDKGRIDMAGMAKLLARFEAHGCKGAVLAGTNGEGPSLSAVEKRDLIRDAQPLKGTLDLILGIATPSWDEAIWLAKRGQEFGAVAGLVMAPSYFRAVSSQAIVDWFLFVLDKSPLPLLIYNFPKMTGVTISAEMMHSLAQHPNMAGCKDSSGEPENILGYKQAMTRSDQCLYVGNEALLIQALKVGWTGTISGASNVLSKWLCQIVDEWTRGDIESAETKFELILPLIESVRTNPQPATHKLCLHALGVLPRPDVRLPLSPADKPAADALLEQIRSRLGEA